MQRQKNEQNQTEITENTAVEAPVRPGFTVRCKRKYRKIRAKFLKKLLNRLKRSRLNALRKGLRSMVIGYIRKKTPLKDTEVLFCTSRGTYNCHPRAIVDEILRRGLPWKLVWVVRKENLRNEAEYPEPLKLVKRDSYEFYREIASAKVLFDNSVNLAYMGYEKKPGQVVFETWHGTFGIKRFETSQDERWIAMAKKSGAYTDYILSNSTFEDDLFRRTFWPDSELLQYGHARNDIFFPNHEAERREIEKKVRAVFEIDNDTHIALYAPTYRDDNEDVTPYDIDYEQLHDTLVERFGGKWCVLSRLHYLAYKQLKGTAHKPWPEYVMDASVYDDIQDLIAATDVGITDYSSWILDYIFLKKPGFLYATDLANYYSERGFYYPLQDLPFPLAENDADLKKEILNFDETAYLQNVNAFLEKVGCLEEGRAAERIVDKLEEILSSEDNRK